MSIPSGKVTGFLGYTLFSGGKRLAQPIKRIAVRSSRTFKGGTTRTEKTDGK
ncbi:hypothetical protein LEP1GSC199_4046 [Leptospira vanthielii serovar Holland str. Waz Holland = ATCC 700522]|uniref:Uncharacterized protein n=1 Tax=Leptospira vanthielii serovar Holland str. Waz Holland = ATCC 700522 TaxID=1218591 RepID=N1W3J1_9LEPT|nr:hypothetical protein LEP1GSC199_4046 [Leptospira vanthielii serovar Holland str. Waz Holland = ATCC 700522]